MTSEGPTPKDKNSNMGRLGTAAAFFGFAAMQHLACVAGSMQMCRRTWAARRKGRGKAAAVSWLQERRQAIMRGWRAVTQAGCFRCWA